MIDRWFVRVSALACAALSVPAQEAAEATAAAPILEDSIVAAIKHEGLENSRVMEYLDHLTNRIGHRLTGSRNYEIARDWAKAEFEKMGLEVELEHWGTWPVGWDRGQWHGRVVEPEALELQVACDAWTAPTKGRVRAPLVRAPRDADELARMREDLTGAYLLEPLGTERFRGLREFVAEHGIAGWITSSVGSAEHPDRIRVFGDPPRSADKLPTIPEIVVRADQFAELERMLSGDAPVVVEFDMRNRWRDGPIELHNVIAELPGATAPEEVVVVCGHLDSWHQATGTTDNGTGVTTTLEAARILTAVGAAPLRTIRFCLWSGEEQGLLGSHQHVQRRRSEMRNVSIVLNHDTGTNWAQGLTVNAVNLDAMQRVVAPLLTLTAPDPQWPVFELEGVGRIGPGGGSDHASFLSARVPAFAWELEGRVDYGGYTWHSQWDTFDVAVPEYQRHTATVVALTALGVARLPDKLSNEGIDPSQRGRLAAVMSRRFAADFGGDDDLVVTGIEAGGRAARMGLEDGDRIVGVDGEDLDSLADLRLALRSIGDLVVITVDRGGETVELEVDGEVLKSRRRAR